MSLVKIMQEFKTILDFSSGKISKNMISQALKNVEIKAMIPVKNSDTIILMSNNIKVGMYQIVLLFSSDDPNKSKLKEFGGFSIILYEKQKNNSLKYIDYCKDKRFKNQNWIGTSIGYKLRTKHLVDIIYFLRRLNNLKLFL